MDIHIAVIDDGISEKLYNIDRLEYDIEIDSDAMVLERRGYDMFEPSHGTTCAAIIKKYTSDTMLSSVKILNKNTKRGMKAQFIRAIQWCMENKVHIVNLSLGSIDFRDFEDIKLVINEAYNSGLIIVAAYNNWNVLTYPASLSTVLGVRCCEGKKLSEGEYHYNAYPFDGIEITSFSEHTLFDFRGKSEKTFPCNSFAAPMITATVCNIIKKSPGISLEGIKSELSKRAKNMILKNYCFNLSRNPDWAKRLLVFNIGESCSDTIIPYSFEVKETIDFMDLEGKDLLIEIEEYIKEHSDILSEVDTIALIISTRLCFDRELDNILFALDRCGKNIILIDDKKRAKSFYGAIKGIRKKIWYSVACNYFIKKRRYKKNTDIPIIAVCDFAGKSYLDFSKELNVLFMKDGYNSVVVTPSPLGVLAGFEVIPFLKHANDLNTCADAINSVAGVYDPDLIILALDISCMKGRFIDDIVRLLEIDIILAPFDGKVKREDFLKAHCEKVSVLYDVTKHSGHGNNLSEIKRIYDELVMVLQSKC